jgi:S-adenosylmethionine-dependent methyltransferase
MTEPKDRNFDDLAERFSRKIYGGLKGDIRLAVLTADLTPVIAQLMHKRQAPLRILDVAGGLGQLSIYFAQQGHQVMVNDVSSVMLGQARDTAREAGVENAMTWHCGPYQQLNAVLKGQCFDLVLCHALLEWLQDPEFLIPALEPLVAPDGILSLCFYNPASIVYRNLMRGNFDRIINTHNYTPDGGSLTPQNPCSLAQVRQWLAQSHFSIQQESGLRVFSDYVQEKRGGNLQPEQVLAMELAHSGQEPYKWMGRYLHVLASRARRREIR